MKTINKLSKREQEVIQEAAYGRTNEEIAGKLGVGTETVKTHIKKALLKLDANNRAHAVAILLREGYIN